MLIDLLDNLEWYRALHPAMQGIITIMDRSLPYQEEPGTYTVDGISYEVMEYESSESGEIHQANETEVHILLEGEELFSLQRGSTVDVVTQCTTGLFVVLRQGESYRHKQQIHTQLRVKKVVFSLPDPAA
ncbi:MAG: YhcH/YjgK/YiaL family protein [Sphaerochaeta sp.]